jgi:hypothetical protein
MNDFETNDAASQAHLAEQQLAIVTRLWRAVTTLHHIDEVFQWVAMQIVERFQVQAAEIWALQLDPTGHYSLQVRTLMTADNSLPEHVIANHHIAEFAERLYSEQRNYPLQMVNQIFAGYPAAMLTRYGLNYITSAYFHGPATLLPAARHAPAPMNRPVPFTLVVLLFQHERRSGDLLIPLQFILPQVVLAAKNHDLLPQAQATPLPQAPNTPIPQQQAQSEFWQLIPHRRREAELLMSSNPLASSVDIPDKQARRLYGAIDGKKNIGALSRATGMEPQEVIRALKHLIAQKRVELYEPGGKLINPSHLLP